MDTDIAALRQYTETGSAEAFADLVERYTGLVYGTCLRITKNAHDAEDISQECFIELVRKAHSVSSSLAGWLHATATSRSKDKIKSAVRRREREKEAICEPAAVHERTWEEVVPYIDDALEELPDELRIPIVLRYFQGKNQSQVAEELGINQSTVCRRLEVGVEELRGKLKKVGIIASAVAVMSVLTTNVAVAVPATLATSLGKMAIAGVGKATSVAAATTATTATTTFAGTAAVKIAAIAVAGTVIVGGAAVYEYKTKHMVQREFDSRPIVGNVTKNERVEPQGNEATTQSEDGVPAENEAAGQTSPSLVAYSRSYDPVTTAKAAIESVVFSDEFNEDGKLAKWAEMKRVSENDVKDGHLLMVNDYEKIRKAEGDKTDWPTRLTYQLGARAGNITCECKIDDFVPGTNCLFQINMGASPGNMLILDRWSGGGTEQAVKVQVISDNKPRLVEQVPYAGDSVILKTQYIALTGELRAFYKETPDSEYKELPGSPYLLEEFKKGPYSVVLLSYNYMKGSPASVKLDWARISVGTE